MYINLDGLDYDIIPNINSQPSIDREMVTKYSAILLVN